MPARSVITVILAGLVALAAVALLLGENGRRGGERTLAGIDRADVDRITINRPGKPDLVFHKQDGIWSLRKPIDIHARPERVNAILSLPRAISHDRIDAGEADLATLRLDPPRVSVELGGQRFLFGGTDPIDDRRYVLEGETVHLIEDRLFHQLTQPAAFYVDTRLLKPGAEITRITYPDHVILREGDRWRGRPGSAAPEESAAAIAANWRDAEAQRVVGYGETQAEGRVTIETRDGAMAFDWMIAQGSLLLARPDVGVQYQLSNETAEGLGLADYLKE